MTLFATLTIAGLAAAVTHQIQAGPGLTFEPETLNASTGDVLEFHFYAKNHSVALGDYDKACQFPETGGFFSGYVPVSGNISSNQVFRVTVNNTDPIWYYCTQSQHCPGGMVGVVNPPAEVTDGSLQVYKIASAEYAGHPDDAAAPFGGVLTTAGSDDGATTTVPTTASPSSTNAAPGLELEFINGVFGALGLAIVGLI